MKKSCVGKATSMDLDEVKVPLVVYRKQQDDGSIMYHGFIPGIMKEDIVDSNLELVKLKLNSSARETINEMLDNHSPMPFFPDKEAIATDYDDVVYIKFLKLK